MYIKVIVWVFYLMIMDPSTEQGTLMRYEYPTLDLCNKSAGKIVKLMRWNKSPKCYPLTVKGQET